MNTDSATEIRDLVSPLDPAGPGRITDAQLAADAPPIGVILQRAAGPAARSPRPAWTRQRLVRWGTPGLLGALAAGAIAAAVVHDDTPASVTNLVRCYSVDHLTTDTRLYTDTTAADTPGQPAPDQSATVTSAVSACTGLWQIGLLQAGTGLNIHLDGTNDHPVPALTACVLNDGRAAVLPGDDQTCHRLGLPRLADRKSAS